MQNGNALSLIKGSVFEVVNRSNAFLFNFVLRLPLGQRNSSLLVIDTDNFKNQTDTARTFDFVNQQTEFFYPRDGF